MTDNMRVGLLATGLVLPWAVAGLVGRLAYRLTVQHGRDLLEIEALQQQVRQVSSDETDDGSGLPIGSKLQDFELPDLDGHKVAFHQFRGRRVLLIFVDPACEHSTSMLSQLTTLSADGADGRPLPLVLTTGDEEENRTLFRTHGIKLRVLRQDAMEVGALYRVTGTPAAYLVDEGGMTASTIALGAEAVLGFAGVLGVGPAPDTGVTRQQHHSLEQSRILRSGLPAGTPAPDFRLPRIDEGELSLADYRGRRVLLVFSDPNCGPCAAVAPELERIHRDFPDLSVLMVSRGDREANREKAQKHRLTFPIAVQRHWDTSRLYGMFATPIAFLVDENGVIATDVAVGPDAIVGLVSGDAGRREVAAQR